MKKEPYLVKVLKKLNKEKKKVFLKSLLKTLKLTNEKLRLQSKDRKKKAKTQTANGDFMDQFFKQQMTVMMEKNTQTQQKGENPKNLEK